ncbi:MAG: polymer-forming cytoskeletal protein [Clostridia bacterium]|nr:polymer-forming cytoskeletal protein [Clostridia bacterium]
MSEKSNFKKVLKELAGFDEMEQEDVAAPKEEPVVEMPKAHTVEIDSSAFEIEEIQPHVYDEGAYDFSDEQSSVITKSMVVEGSIKSKHDVIVQGTIYGNITTDANVQTSSVVVGNIKAKNASLENSRIKGNIEVKENARICEDTVLVGNVEGLNINVAGKIKGNIDAKDTISLKSTAIVAGDIITDKLLSDGTARIKGSVTAARNATFDEDAEFDLGVDIDGR